jgi:ABC-type Fe3+ transport system permease subunit
MVGAIAAGLGWTARFLATLLRALPGVIGPVAVVYGVWAIYGPAGWIAAGLVLWAWDVLPELLARKSKQEGE